jgi:monoamine oxidase
MHDSYDTAVIGAGGAGLAAAAELAAAGRSVCVLEARNRLGGRIATLRLPQLPVPLELGAEFVHGRPAATGDWFARHNVALIDVPETRWWRRGRGLQTGDGLFDDLQRALQRAGRPRRDLSFGDFLERRAGRALTPRLREFALMLVEGFDAADPGAISAQSVLDEWAGPGAANAPMTRPQQGFGSLIEALAAALDSRYVHLRLSTVVREVRWRAGRVSIAATTHGKERTVEARDAIVALPLGTLQRSLLPVPDAVRFVPALGMKRKALAGLAMGPVIKMLLQFRRPFWEEVDDARYRDAAFFHAPRAAFPTFWTMLPFRVPLLTTWSAGPAASRLAGAGEAAVMDAIRDSLVGIFGREAESAAILEGAWMHDWQSDPFAGGAYSYVLVGHLRARALLARPLEGTLFFAGEATDTDGRSGTVEGAIATGRKAARALLAAR